MESLVSELTALPSGYPALLEDLKVRIRAAQLRAALTLNQETILLYWSIGQDLSSRFAAERWGTKVVDRLAKDLGTEFPGVEGFSLRNLRYMRSFAEAWPDPQILQLAAKLPWGHHMVLLDRLKDGQSRDWYLRASIEYGWSRNVLTHQISTQLREREGKALTNFARTLPSPDSDLTQQILKDPYSFEFLTLSSTAKERELERGLLKHLRDLLYRSALLPSSAPLLLRDRVEDGKIQTRMGGQTQLLPVCSGRSVPQRAGCLDHRATSL